MGFVRPPLPVNAHCARPSVRPTLRETHVDHDGQPRRHEEDVNGDGRVDLVLHFRLEDTSLGCTSVQGTLSGKTLAGQWIEGRDAVRMLDK